MDNVLELKTISELQASRFFIPSYQRGYRWREKEVTDLLNDISEFTPKEIDNTDDKTWYCLQPIVIKENSQGQYEVIDGQQRLTTIYLILHYLNQRYSLEFRQKLFELEYQTRADLHSFLAELQTDEIREDNIDYFLYHQHTRQFVIGLQRKTIKENLILVILNLNSSSQQKLFGMKVMRITQFLYSHALT